MELNPQAAADAPLAQVETTGAVRLREDERDFLVEECAALSDEMPEGPRREAYAALARALEGGAVPEGMTGAVERLLDVGLASDRIRGLYGPHSEMAASRLFARLHRGRELARKVEEANAALELLTGAALEAVSVRLRGSDFYVLEIRAGGKQISLGISPAGPTVQGVEASS